MFFTYVNPQTKEKFTVKINNFDRTGKKVRIVGNPKLNPSNGNYPDKKWIETGELMDLDGNTPKFTREFIKEHTL